MSQGISILHIIDNFGMGGAETWLLELVRYSKKSLPDLSHDFICTGGAESLFDKEIIEHGSSIFYIRYSTTRWFEFRRFFKEILSRKKYDILWNHQDFMAGWHFMAGIGHLPPLRIAYAHNTMQQSYYYRNSPGRKFIFMAGRLLMAFWANHLTGTSRQVLKEYGYVSFPYNRILSDDPIHCAFNVQKFLFNKSDRSHLRAQLNIPEHAIVVLFVGRLSLGNNVQHENPKNPFFAFRLAQKLIALSPEFIFLFVGEKGNVGVEVEQEIRKNNQEKQIRLLGIRKDIEKVFFAADVFIFPSLYEGLGMVAVEAQASNLPVIMSDKVPPEAVVDHSLVRILALREEIWIEELLGAKVTYRAEQINQHVLKSDFNIENCAKNIVKLNEKFKYK